MTTCWERTDLLALLCVMFTCVLVTFLYGVLGQVWYLMVSIPDICLILYFDSKVKVKYLKYVYIHTALVPIFLDVNGLFGL